MTEQPGFHNGRYHDAQKRKMADHVSRSLHEERLSRCYRHSMDLVKAQGWRHPLSSEAPEVLQMGTAGSFTSSIFVDFVRGINPNSRITIADFSRHPLQESQVSLSWEPNVRFVQTDTTALGFADNTFDQIETDGLLQFLTMDQKAQAVAEWSRVLKPGGVVTTRDRFASNNAGQFQWDKLYEVRNHFYNEYEIFSNPSASEDILEIFNGHGFTTILRKTPFNDPGMYLIKDIVAQKPQ